MFTDRLSRITLMIVLICGFAIDGVTLAGAQSGQDVGNDDSIDEIVTSGDKSLITLRTEAEAAQDRLFEAYNLVNDDDDYDFVCEEEAKAGTQLKQRVCRPEIINELVAEDAKRFLRGEDGTTSIGVFERHQQTAMKKLEEAVSNDPELMQMLVDFYTKSKLYQSEHERRCGDKLSNCTE